MMGDPDSRPMFRRSRRRIVAAVLGALVVVFAGMVAMIYATSYYEVTTSNNRMLAQYTRLYWQHGLPGNDASAGTDAPTESADSASVGDSDAANDSCSAPNTPATQDNPIDGRLVADPAGSRTFYAVVFDTDGKVVDYAGSSRTGITETLLAKTGRDMVRDNGVAWTDSDAVADTDTAITAAAGISGRWVYRIEQGDGRTLVAVMDNTILDENMTTLMRYTLIFGVVALLPLAGIAVILARRITRPLERAHAEQRRFITDAGHELKTPIATIGTNAELLARDIGANQWLENITYENRRMELLVQRLLDLEHAEAETEHGKAGFAPVDLSRLVTGSLLSFEPVAFEHGLMLEEHIVEDVTVHGDEVRLGELVSILLDNAIDHASCGSDAAIAVSLAAERHHAVLRVTNPGNLSEEQIGHLFDRFYRADDSRNGEGGHYGLGLSIARAIVAAHHGEITCSSMDGTVTFTVTLPKR